VRTAFLLVLVASGCAEPGQPKPKDPEALMADDCDDASPDPERRCNTKRRPPGPKSIPGSTPGLPGN
jgi:hypothetical protein